MIGKLDEAVHLHSEALRLRAQRQEVIASNLANADTPNYKAVDFKFADALRQAAGVQAAPGQSSSLQTTGPATLARTSAGHMNVGGNQSSSAYLSTRMMYRNPVQGAVDGNTVDVDAERARFADNAVRYEASLRFLNSQLKTLMSAVQGQ